MPLRTQVINVIFALSTLPLYADETLDPSPPIVQKLHPAKPAVLAKHERVKFHQHPKALHKDAITEDWPGFLGKTHNGVSRETRLLKTFPADGPTRVWELAKGNSYASPAILGDYLVFPHRLKNTIIVECLHPLTGEKYWDYKYQTTYEDRYGYGSGPRATPVLEDNRVYHLGVAGEFLCLELSTGRVIWQRNINTDFKVPQDFFGTAGTPLLAGDNLIVNVGAPNGPCVAAFDKHTGKVVWKAGKEWGPSYASPVPGVIHGQNRVFVFAGGDSNPPTGGLISLNPTNGKVDFTFPWRSKKYESVNASCPVVINNSVLISATYRAGTTLIDLNEKVQPQQKWVMTDREHNEEPTSLGLHWNTPIYLDGHIYAFDGRNEPDASLVCVDTLSGKVNWRTVPEWKEKITINGQIHDVTMSTFRGALLQADGDFLCLGEMGHLLWLKLTPQKHTILARTWIFAARESWTPPVIHKGCVYLTQNTPDLISRNQPSLVCLDLRDNQ